MISNHDLSHTDINSSINIIKLKELYVDLLNEILLSSNYSSLETQYVILIGDMCNAINALHEDKSYFKDFKKTVINKKDIPHYLSQHKDMYQALVKSLAELQEYTACDLANQIGQFLYKNWAMSSLTDIVTLQALEKNEKVMLYKAKNGELCIRFATHSQACDFLAALFIKTGGIGVGVIPEKFRVGKQYESNPQGTTPTLYKANDNKIYCPSYLARKSEIGVNLGNQKIRDAMLALLKFKKEKSKIVDFNGFPQLEEGYNNGLFTCYTADGNLPIAAQNSAIYFNSSNKIFNKTGSYIQIDLHTGDMTEGHVLNISLDLSEDDDRRPINNTSTFFKRILTPSSQDLSVDSSVSLNNASIQNNKLTKW